MRLNQFLAQRTSLSRRKADEAITEGRVEINGMLARLGDTVIESDTVTLDSHPLEEHVKIRTIMLNKPTGYVCSRDGQGSPTIYELLPAEYGHLNPIGRLDKNSSGLLLMTNDGELATKLTHPRYQKTKVYQVVLGSALEAHDQDTIHDKGVELEDGISQLHLQALDNTHKKWQIRMQEGRNRQIRRTFAALGYKVTRLHRTSFGDNQLAELESGKYNEVTIS